MSMENHKLELIFKQSLYKNKKCTNAYADSYYLYMKDFEHILVSDYYLDASNDRKWRIELIVVSNQSKEYKIAVSNSGKNKMKNELLINEIDKHLIIKN